MTREPADLLLEVLAEIGWYPYARIAGVTFSFDLGALGVVSRAHVMLDSAHLSMDIDLHGTIPPSQQRACEAEIARLNRFLAVGQLVPGDRDGAWRFRHHVDLPACTLEVSSVHALVIESLEAVESLWNDVSPMLTHPDPRSHYCAPADVNNQSW